MKLSRWLLVAGFALLILGAKFALIGQAGSDLPVLDQWDAEGEMTLPSAVHRDQPAVRPHLDRNVMACTIVPYRRYEDAFATGHCGTILLGGGP